jgi:hypothetical protein
MLTLVPGLAVWSLARKVQLTASGDCLIVAGSMCTAKPTVPPMVASSRQAAGIAVLAAGFVAVTGALSGVAGGLVCRLQAPRQGARHVARTAATAAAHRLLFIAEVLSGHE